MKKQFTFTKILGAILLLLFTYCIISITFRDFSSITDTTPFVTSITVTGGILATYAIWYLRKSERENIPRMQYGIYKDTLDLQVDYYERMIKIKQKYGIIDSDIEQIKSESNIDEISDSKLTTLTTQLDSDASELSQKTEQQTF